MPIYKCPLCSESLTLEQRSYLCENKHCFDIAKEGYVNLLPVQSKKSKSPGDSKPMLAGRQQFLRQGYYDFLVRDIANLICQHGAAGGRADLLDMGCGEGYYSEQLAGDNQQLNIAAVDRKRVTNGAGKRHKTLDIVALALPLVE
jgi:23S rRNA (guanine745-N1)-methyltransferase